MEARRTPPEVFRGSIFASKSIAFSERNALTGRGLSAAGGWRFPRVRHCRGQATEEENAARLCSRRSAESALRIKCNELAVVQNMLPGTAGAV